MAISGKRILVTGGAGFIGSNLVDALLEKGSDVIVLDDFSTGHHDNLREAKKHPRFTMVEGSILDRTLIESLVTQVDMIFHLAVQCLRVCFDRPHLVHEVNATGTLNLLDAAQRLHPKLERFVYVSSSEVYGTAKTAPMDENHPLDPTTVYGASKLAGELYTTAFFTTYQLPTMILRPFNTYGYREHYEGFSGEVIPRFVVRILNNQPPVIFGDGSQTRDFTFVTDTVEGLIRSAASDKLLGQTTNIAYGQEVSIKEIADRLLKLLGREDLGIERVEDRPGDVFRHYANVEKLERLTGFRPVIDIQTGLEKFVDWFRREHPEPEKLLTACQTRNWEVDDASVYAAISS